MREISIDNFAGGGGTSEGYELAIGVPPDYAINHDQVALWMHEVNHPGTKHLCANVLAVDPDEFDSPIGFAWFSPDCRHFSKAKGGRPVEKSIRDLAWVAIRYASRRRDGPRVIMLENVEEFLTWGPLGEGGQPCPDRRGQTFAQWVAELQRLGYVVEWRVSRAAWYGAPTIRRRLFVIARRDGEPIVWPPATHGDPSIEPELLPWLAAGDHVVDWSLPCPSIFATSEEIKAEHGIRAIRPLANASMSRLAKGVVRYVVNAKEPYIAPMRYTGGDRAHLVAAFMAQHNLGVVGRPADQPLSTITQAGSQQNLVAVSLVRYFGTAIGSSLNNPTRTVMAHGAGGKSGLVAAFLTKYYGADQDPSLAEPLHTVTTLDRFGLVTVSVCGETYVVNDIGMRMFTPRELYRAMGFRESYIIDRGPDGQIISRKQQVAKCGNAVSPPHAQAHIAANYRPRDVAWPAESSFLEAAE